MNKIIENSTDYIELCLSKLQTAESVERVLRLENEILDAALIAFDSDKISADEFVEVIRSISNIIEIRRYRYVSKM